MMRMTWCASTVDSPSVRLPRVGLSEKAERNIVCGMFGFIPNTVMSSTVCTPATSAIAGSVSVGSMRRFFT